MNKSNLKSYAPQARKDFIAAVTARAHQLGFTSTHVNDATLRGDVLIIDGVEWPAKVAGQRAKLFESYLRKLRLALLDVIESGQKARLQ
jgi:hypothetical protein